MFVKNSLHNRQGHSFVVQYLILDLNELREGGSFMSRGTSFHILGPK